MKDKHTPAGEQVANQQMITATGRRKLDSTVLLGLDNELIIAHGPDEYRLRLTRQGKLILTK